VNKVFERYRGWLDEQESPVLDVHERRERPLNVSSAEGVTVLANVIKTEN
jgi:hypothetical protein